MCYKIETVFLKVQKLSVMKRTFVFIFSFFLFFSATAQTAAKTDALEFKEMEYDFGKIPQGKPVYHFFEVVNNGTKPVKLTDVHASCGCTTPEWSRDEIAPGATAKIKVGFNAASAAPFEKFITVQTDDNTSKQLKIKGTVWQAPTTAAPANASVQFLKQQIL